MKRKLIYFQCYKFFYINCNYKFYNFNYNNVHIQPIPIKLGLSLVLTMWCITRYIIMRYIIRAYKPLPPDHQGRYFMRIIISRNTCFGKVKGVVEFWRIWASCTLYTELLFRTLSRTKLYCGVFWKHAWYISTWRNLEQLTTRCTLSALIETVFLVLLAVRNLQVGKKLVTW